MLYEVYASPEAFQTHLNGTSIQQVKQETAGLQASLKERGAAICLNNITQFTGARRKVVS